MTTTAHLVKAGTILKTATFASSADLPAQAASKGRWLPEVTVSPDFDPATQDRQGPVLTVEANRVLATWTVTAKTPDEVAAMRAAKVAAVNAEAERRILAIMPEYQQRNTLALGVEFITTYGADLAGWPSEQLAIYESAMADWSAIKAVRATSNILTAAIPTDAAGIAAVDPMAGWD